MRCNNDGEKFCRGGRDASSKLIKLRYAEAMVLMYHNIASGEQCIDFAEWQPAYDVSLAQFRAHVALFRAQTESAPVHLTFDDGYDSLQHHVWPLLEKERLRCTCFMTTAMLGKRGMLCREALQALARAGVNFGTHSHSHIFLTQLTRAQMEQEIRAPQKILADLLGKEITALSLPGGRYDEAALGYAHACGYREIFTSIPGNEAMPSKKFSGLSLWPRWVITKQTSHAEMVKIVRAERWHLLQSRARHGFGKFSKRVLGHRGYHLLWQNLQYLKTSSRDGRATS